MAGEISTKFVSIEVSEGDTITVKIPADGGMPSVHKNKFRYHYGPTSTDPDAGKMWHYDCGGEVYAFEEGLICSKCGQSEECEIRAGDAVKIKDGVATLVTLSLE